MKTAIAILMTLVLVLAQTTLCPLITVLGTHPNLVMAAVACVGLLYGRMIGGIVGMLCGLWIDSLFPAAFGVYILAYALCGLVAGGWKNNARSENRWWGAHLDAILGDRSFSGRWRSDRVLRPFIAAAIPAAGMELVLAVIIYFMRLPINPFRVVLQMVAAGALAGLAAAVFFQLYALCAPREGKSMRL